jgi:hypothetical protein
MTDCYDDAIALLTAQMQTDRMSVWRAYCEPLRHEAGCLFKLCAPPGVNPSHPEMVADVFTARFGCKTYDGFLSDELFKDERIPTVSWYITLKHLPVFAARQRQMDAHWVSVADRLSVLKSSFKPAGFGDWILPSQRVRLRNISNGIIGKTPPYDANLRCLDELGIGVLDLSRQAAEALIAEWRERPRWSAP